MTLESIKLPIYTSSRYLLCVTLGRGRLCAGQIFALTMWLRMIFWEQMSRKFSVTQRQYVEFVTKVSINICDTSLACTVVTVTKRRRMRVNGSFRQKARQRTLDGRLPMFFMALKPFWKMFCAIELAAGELRKAETHRPENHGFSLDSRW